MRKAVDQLQRHVNACIEKLLMHLLGSVTPRIGRAYRHDSSESRGGTGLN
jgi:hypothetical protein